MKLFKRFLTGASVLALISIFGVRTSNAQIWAYYDMVIENQFFNPLVGNPITVLSDFDFRDFSGNVDRDDGVDNNIPVGFTFDYNNGLYSTVNVCVNGWASVGVQSTPVITHDKYYLFSANQPNNTLAPFWGDHYYRTPTDISGGYTPSKIQYAVSAVSDPNPNAPAGSLLRTFTLEWKDLNINDKANINSIATFQLKIVQNPMANDALVPDQRAKFEFHYGPVGNSGTVRTQGSTVGIEDSVSDSLAHSFMNGIFPSSFAGEDSTRRNRDSLTSCWPPASCLPGRIIAFVPQGQGTFSQWGDGDVNLTQLNPNDPPEVRVNQNRFVTLADADALLIAVARAYPTLDSVEGREAFHGDANHNGQYQNPLYPGFNFYRVTAYDGAYILMYLAAKLPFLPWPQPLLLPVYKEMNSDATNISGLFADTKNTSVRGNTTLVPLVLRGTVNGAIGFDLNVKIPNNGLLQLVGAESSKGLIQHNAETGKVVFAASGKFADGDILGYLQFNEEKNVTADFELTDVMINDEAYASSRSTLDVGAGQTPVALGNVLEQNAPNPFVISTSSLTTIRYNLESASSVTLKIYDMLGAEIRAFAVNVGAGPHEIKWDGRDNSGRMVSSGAYYYQITTSDFTQTVKMSVIR